jgi:tRNA(fMet)-specific endonuclease VapC
MITHLLDTNIVSYTVKGQPPAVRERLARVSPAKVAISAITEAELRYGLARKPEAHRLHRATESLLTRVNILPWDSPAAKAYGELRHNLETTGQKLEMADLLLAAQALADGLILVTHDHAFSRIKKLKIEDWINPFS